MVLSEKRAQRTCTNEACACSMRCISWRAHAITCHGVSSTGGKISGLFPTQLAGSDSFEWNGGVYPLKPPIEANDLRHDRKNLLSHKKFNAGPEFDILLSPCGELDGSNTVFGEVLAGEELLLEMAQLPFVTGKSLDPQGSVASNICASFSASAPRVFLASSLVGHAGRSLSESLWSDGTSRWT